MKSDRRYQRAFWLARRWQGRWLTFAHKRNAPQLQLSVAVRYGPRLRGSKVSDNACFIASPPAALPHRLSSHIGDSKFQSSLINFNASQDVVIVYWSLHLCYNRQFNVSSGLGFWWWSTIVAFGTTSGTQAKYNASGRRHQYIVRTYVSLLA